MMWNLCSWALERYFKLFWKIVKNKTGKKIELIDCCVVTVMYVMYVIIY